MRHVFLGTICFALVLGICQTGASQEESTQPSESDTEAIHDELRKLRDDVLDAYQKKDIDRLLKHMHENAVVTLQNAETLKGHKAIREFHEKMNEGDNPSVKTVNSKFEVDELSTLYGGDTAVAFGSMSEEFELQSGMNFSLTSRWTATLVKEDDQWKVASFQIATNMFDNGVLDSLLSWNSLKFGGLGLVVGVIVCLIVLKLMGKLGKSNPA
ncbi:MAG: DUF4440 domain-containing protein [Planctomycetaceae bacterium]|nr:DUF4440 domain-containing protein [Planctomycetaceae bacterium]